MAITDDRTEQYDAPANERPGAAEHERATEHRDRALDALADDPHVALVHALLAVEARVDELVWHVAQRA